MQKDAFLAIAVGPARASQKATGVPASVTLAQAIIESGWGESHMGDAWNFFGIKAQGDEPFVVVRTREVVDGKDVFVNAKFRRFASMEDCFREHGRFLRDNPRYAPAFRTADAEGFARAIHAAGYATDPHYGDALIGIIRDNDLTRYDTAPESRKLAGRDEAEVPRGVRAAASERERAGREGDPEGSRRCRVQAGADRRSVRREHGRRRAALSEGAWPYRGRSRRSHHRRPPPRQSRARLALGTTCPLLHR